MVCIFVQDYGEIIYYNNKYKFKNILIINIMMTIFYKILESQSNFKNEYKKCDKKLNDLVIIQIKDNKISNIIDGLGWIHSTRKKQYIALISNVLSKFTIKDGNININLADHPQKGCLNFCRKINENYFLLPDFRFTLSDIKLDENWFQDKFKNYEEETNYMKNLYSIYPFNKKLNKFYTNCIPHESKINYFLYGLENKDIINGHIYGGSVNKYKNLSKNFIEKLKLNSLAGENFHYFNEHFKYKYIIYNDGNTLSDRIKLLLNVNSVIIKKKSPYEEFYSYLLKDNINYIEYENENELRNIHNKLENTEKLCLQIIENNKKFVNEILTYDNILKYIADLLNILL